MKESSSIGESLKIVVTKAYKPCPFCGAPGVNMTKRAVVYDVNGNSKSAVSCLNGDCFFWLPLTEADWQKERFYE